MKCTPWLLCLCLGFQLKAAQGPAGQDRAAAPRSAFWSGYETVQSQLGVVRALSERYWRFLASQLWQQGDCEEETDRLEQHNEGEAEGSAAILEEQEAECAAKLFSVKTDLAPGDYMDEATQHSRQHFWKEWSLPLLTELVSTWYCSFGTCCTRGDCRLTNNLTGLTLDLSRRLHGQHLAKEVVPKAIQGFLETPQPDKALTLSFHGWSGTGKNFAARLIAERLYRDGLKSDCVRVFISVFHFPHPQYVDCYKVQLAKQISETVQICEQSLFIFDEAEKLHNELLDSLKPYVDHYVTSDKVDCRRSIFLFLSNTGGNIINKVALDFWQAGQTREEITMKNIEQDLRRELLDVTDAGYAPNCLVQENLIDFLVPFLPLEYHHVKLCARDAFLARGLQFTEEMLDEVARMMVFVPKEKKLFSAQGCKSVSQRINYFLH